MTTQTFCTLMLALIAVGMSFCCAYLKSQLTKVTDAANGLAAMCLRAKAMEGILFENKSEYEVKEFDDAKGKYQLACIKKYRDWSFEVRVKVFDTPDAEANKRNAEELLKHLTEKN